MKVIYTAAQSTGNIDSVRKDAKEFVYEQLDYMCDREILLEDINDLIENAQMAKNARFTNEKSTMIEDFENAISENELCWIEEVFFFPAEGDGLSDPTDSGEDELIFEIRACFKFGRCICDDAGTGELEVRDYNRIMEDEGGYIHGKRIWTNGKLPTIEERKEIKWKGLEKYTNI